MILRLALSLSVILLLNDCGGGPHADAGGPRVEVGNGEGVFSSIEDGQTLDLVSGCQGSQHVWGAVRGWQIEPNGTILDLSLVRDRDGAMVSQTFRVRVSLRPVEGQPYAEAAGLTVVVPDPDQAIGEDLTLRLTVTDLNGVELSDERSVRIDWGVGGCR